MALFLLGLLAGGVWLRVTHGRALPRVTEKWDAKRKRTVKQGQFEVALYKLSPAAWRVYATTLDLLGATVLVAGIVACLRMAVTGRG